MSSAPSRTRPSPGGATELKPNLSRSITRCRGRTIVTETSSFSRASGNAPITSARPPTLAKGTHSAAAIRTRRLAMVGSNSAVNEFPCAVRCTDHRFDQGDSQPAVFELEYAVDGAAGGSCHDVLKLSRMLAGFENHAGSAKHHLRSQLCSGFAR